MRIRPFAPEDSGAVVALWHEAGVTRPWNDPLADIERKRAVQPELFLVAVDANQPVGVIMAGFDGHRGWLNYLAVAERYRGSGLGRRLVEAAEAELAALGCPKIQLQVRPENTKVLGFYEHLGYTCYEVVDMGKRIVDDLHRESAP